MIVDLGATAVAGGLIVFARLGSALMVMPVFGDAQVPGRVRLLIALACTLVVAPLVQPLIQPPEEPARLALLVAGEVALGLVIGLSARLLLAALHVAGSAMALQSGLAAAAFFDPGETSQRTIFVTYLTLLVIPLVLASDGHHWLISALASSYGRLAPGAALPVGDLVELMVRLTALAFETGVRIAMPLLALATVVNLLFGILNRLMPALQAMLVAIPAQVLSGFLIVIASLAAALAAALELLEHTTLWLR